MVANSPRANTRSVGLTTSSMARSFRLQTDYLFSPFSHSFISLRCVCVCEHRCGGQRTTRGSCSSSTHPTPRDWSQVWQQVPRLLSRLASPKGYILYLKYTSLDSKVDGFYMESKWSLLQNTLRSSAVVIFQKPGNGLHGQNFILRKWMQNYHEILCHWL